MEYEGLHIICFDCGGYGHRKENHPRVIAQKAATDPVEGGKTDPPVAEAVPQLFPGVNHTSVRLPAEGDSLYSPWMILRQFRYGKISYSGR